jgi:hypothetical protein
MEDKVVAENRQEPTGRVIPGRPEPTILQTVTPAADTLDMTWANATDLNDEAPRIPHISLTGLLARAHLIRRSMPRVQPVRQNLYTPASTLPGVRQRCRCGQSANPVAA